MSPRFLFALLPSLFVCTNFQVWADDYTPGAQHLFTHESGDVPLDTYQYSLWVPKDYKPDHRYPVVFFLHGSTGRHHPNEATKNMVADRLVDNKPWTTAGYSGNHPNQFGRGYLHVAPAKPGFSWDMDKFKRLLDDVKSKVNIDADRVYVMGFSMGGRGAWEVASIADPKYRIAAILPIGAYACDVVQRGTTPETCLTVKTPVWVQHCPRDDVSKISEQILLLQNHLDC
ncbi:alpha/beta hydrolase-fold protein, partial [Verrucomicrobiales bacterium]|nr:alpha/beta hydrolase-fold protein [Verrucomicrobiales bacterium]